MSEMSGDNKAWSVFVLMVGVVLLALITSIWHYNIRSAHEIEETRQTAIKSGMCETPVMGGGGYHWEKCK